MKQITVIACTRAGEINLGTFLAKSIGHAIRKAKKELNVRCSSFLVRVG